jgi:hypothetical protein
MQEKQERWRTLTEQAAIEQDPERLLDLIREINRLLEEKEDRLLRRRKDNIQRSTQF